MTIVAVVLAHKPGSVVASRYRLVRELGRGAMGVVWEAEHLTLHAPVAVKFIEPELLEPDAEDREEVLTRFVREAQAAALIRSAHVVQVLDHGVEQDIPFMVMELLDGETLEERLETQHSLSAEVTSKIITHIARAAGKAHEAGIVHRDLKPGNVFLVKNDEDEVGKVLDFGIAKFTKSQGQGGVLSTKAGLLIGTPAYMSPEQASGVDVVDYRTDLWAIGVIAFQCLTGRLPFESEGVGELILQICAKPIPVPSQVAQVPMGFDEWFARAVARDPAERFESAKAMADALREVLTGELATDPKLRLPPELAARVSGSTRGEDAQSAAETVLAVSAAQLTHRAVVSQLRHTRSSRSFYKTVIGSAVLTVVALAVLAIYLFGSDPPPAEGITAASKGDPTSATSVDSRVMVEPAAEPAIADVVVKAPGDEKASGGGGEKASGDGDEDADGAGGATADDPRAAGSDTAVVVTPRRPRPPRPRPTKKKAAPSDHDRRLGF